MLPFRRQLHNTLSDGEHDFSYFIVVNRNVLLLQSFMPVLRQISSEFFIFQQDMPQALGAQLFPINLPNVERFQKFLQKKLSGTFVIKYS